MKKILSSPSTLSPAAISVLVSAPSPVIPVLVPVVHIPKNLSGFKFMTPMEYQTANAMFLSRFTPLYPMSNFSNVSMLIDFSRSFFMVHPLHHFLFLGQSYAWMARTGVLTNAVHSNRVSTVPFLGNFVQSVYDPLDRESGPTPTQLAQFKSVCEKLQVSPKQIVDRYEKYSKFTALVDFVSTGKGLSSFLWCLRSWAMDDGVSESKMFSAMSLRLFYSPENPGAGLVLNGFSGIVPDTMGYIAPRGSFFFNITVADAFQDRVMPRYPYTKWDDASVDPLDPKYNLVSKMLIDFRIMSVQMMMNAQQSLRVFPMDAHATATNRMR